LLNLGLFCLIFLLNVEVKAQTTNEVIPSGSFIVNMGITPQNASNALRPYGMLYNLLRDFQVPIKWVINPTKVKDGVDFTYNNVSYRGGAFVIQAGFRTAAVNARISFWQGRGVRGVTTTSPVTLPVYTTLSIVPKWTLDRDNGKIAVDFFQNAEIPSTAYGGSSESGWTRPGNLTCCDDLFVMPHADPVWSTHGRLLSWNLECKGGIWLGCHAGSALEDMFNPGNKSQQTNFLSEKTGTATGNDDYSENALILWDNHDDGTPPYTYAFSSDPVMQFMGIMDNATQNGSEQVFVPLNPGWRPTTKVGVYDPNQPDRVSNLAKNRPAIVAFGRGFGDDNRGLVMMQASHDIAKKSDPANIAAQRAFFNFSFIALSDKSVLPTLTGVTPNLAPGGSSTFTLTVPSPANISNYSVAWTSSCGGTFSPSTGPNVTFTAPNSVSTSPCTITATITDPCGRKTFSTETVTIQCDLSVTNTITQVCGSNPNSGAITMSITGGTAPYSYTWTRSGGGSGSGSGTNITGLSAGTYNVTVNSANGCVKTFTATVSSSPTIVITPTILPVSCSGGATGGINLNVTGGTPGYTFNWGGGVTTQNRSGLSAGNYSVTVTDTRGCTATQGTITVTQPVVISATPVVTNVLCFGETTGSIVLNVSGGASPYTYQWADGTTTKDRNNISAGTYSVTITDANNCTQTVNNINVTQAGSALAATTTQNAPDCGATDGSITVSVSGGTGAYTYDWTGTPTGDGTPTITGLAGGSYQVTITDANSCTLVKSEMLISTSGILLTAQVINPSCPPGSNAPLGSNGAIDLTVSGGTAPFTYSWTTTNGTGLVAADEDQTDLTAGTYVVVVTDNTGCTATTTVVLTNINPSPVQPAVINND
jgi:hypothetical protein